MFLILVTKDCLLGTLCTVATVLDSNELDSMKQTCNKATKADIGNNLFYGANSSTPEADCFIELGTHHREARVPWWDTLWMRLCVICPPLQPRPPIISYYDVTSVRAVLRILLVGNDAGFGITSHSQLHWISLTTSRVNSRITRMRAWHLLSDSFGELKKKANVSLSISFLKQVKPHLPIFTV